MTHFQTLPTCSLYNVSFKIKLWQPELRPIQSSINREYLLLVGSNSVTFFGRTIALPDEAVIDWLIKRAQLTPAVGHSPAASVLGHSWPTFSLSLPVQSSLFTLLSAECFLSRPVSKTPMGCQQFQSDPRTCNTIKHYIKSVENKFLKKLFKKMKKKFCAKISGPPIYQWSFPVPIKLTFTVYFYTKSDESTRTFLFPKIPPKTVQIWPKTQKSGQKHFSYRFAIEFWKSWWNRKCVRVYYGHYGHYVTTVTTVIVIIRVLESSGVIRFEKIWGEKKDIACGESESEWKISKKRTEVSDIKRAPAFWTFWMAPSWLPSSASRRLCFFFKFCTPVRSRP